MTNRPVLCMITPGCMGMVFHHWQGAQVRLDFRGHIFHHYRLPGGKKKRSSQPLLPLFGELIKMPNYTQPHLQPGQAQLSVWETYMSGLLCVHTSISGIRDKAVVHDHIKPLAGIVMPLH